MSQRPLVAVLPLAAFLALTACSSTSQEQTQAEASASASPVSQSTAASTTPSPTPTGTGETSTPEEDKNQDAETAHPSLTASPDATAKTVNPAPSETPVQAITPAPAETPVQAINPPANSGETTLVTDLAPYQTSIDGVTPANDGKVYFQTADGAGCVMGTEQVSCYRAGSQGRIGYGVMWLDPGSVPYQDFLQGSSPGFAPFSFGTQLPANHTITVGEFTCTATADGAARCDNGVHWFALSNSIKDFSG